MKIMIRYKAGCGGETLSWFLDENLNGNSQSDQSSENGRKHYDVFNSILHHRLIPNYLFSDQKNRHWHDLPIDIVRDWVNDTVNSSEKNHIIGKAHPNIFFKNQWSEIFSDWYIIDIFPKPTRTWVIELLLYHKAVFFKLPFDVDPKYSNHPQYKEAKTFFSKNGWIPSYWHWILPRNNMSIHDIDGFFKMNKEFIEDIAKYNQYQSTVRIDGSTLVADQTLYNFHKIVDIFNMTKCKNLSKTIIEVENWINNNRNIFDDFGVLNKVDEDYEMNEDETYDLLRNLFWSRAIKLTNGEY